MYTHITCIYIYIYRERERCIQYTYTVHIIHVHNYHIILRATADLSAAVLNIDRSAEATQRKVRPVASNDGFPLWAMASPHAKTPQD